MIREIGIQTGPDNIWVLKEAYVLICFSNKGKIISSTGVLKCRVVLAHFCLTS